LESEVPVNFCGLGIGLALDFSVVEDLFGVKALCLEKSVAGSACFVVRDLFWL